jgi:hypothetical protein
VHEQVVFPSVPFHPPTSLFKALMRKPKVLLPAISSRETPVLMGRPPKNLFKA